MDQRGAHGYVNIASGWLTFPIAEATGHKKEENPRNLEAVEDEKNGNQDRSGNRQSRDKERGNWEERRRDREKMKRAHRSARTGGRMGSVPVRRRPAKLTEGQSRCLYT